MAFAKGASKILKTVHFDTNRNDWQIPADFNAERRSREATFQTYPIWLAVYEKCRTSFD